MNSERQTFPDASGITVAIDGPAGAGKSTVAKAVAAALGYTLVDTGAIYRSVALLGRRQDVDWSDAGGLARIVSGLNIRFQLEGAINRVFLEDEDITGAIRTPEIDQGASRVSAHSQVRQGLLALQRKLAGAGGAVLEGRDIGTVVCPEAAVKVFLDASLEERAQRRCQELQARGENPDYEQVYRDVHDRDERDRRRAHAPLRAARDAVVLDSTSLSVDAVVRRIVQMVKEAQRSG